MDKRGSKSIFKQPQKWNGLFRFVKDSDATKESLRDMPFHFCGGLPKVLLLAPSSTLAWVTFFS